VAGAAAFGEVILLATPWSGTEQALRSAGNLSGKIVLDATNPLKADLSGLALGHTTSGGEQVAAWAAGAKVVKIFNTTGFGNMENRQSYFEQLAALPQQGTYRIKVLAGKPSSEVALLARSFNRMRRSLQKAIELIEK